jgi:predicted TIM-barrel fold metal-dependent hydrolase
MGLPTTSSKIRDQLDHPVIDADGHCVEYHPAISAILAEVAGADVARRYKLAPVGHFNWYDQTVEQRVERRTIRPPWWGVPSANTNDRAMAVIPQVMYERLDEAGVDASILYPTLGLFAMAIANDELRQAGCRAFNTYYHRVYEPYSDRLIPNAIIPMHTPEEAIAELDYCVGELGFRAILMAGHVRRPIPAATENDAGAGRYALWFDNLAVDSEHDYDPVWQRCVELGVAPTFHSGGQGWGSRQSVSNYVYNHVGAFASACEAICKSLFLGGVTARFPTLKFAFLEGGVGWASNLYNDLVGHHEKRNGRNIGHYDPSNLDRDLMARLLRDKGGELLAIAGEESVDPAVAMMGTAHEPPDMLDEFAAIGLESTEDIRDAFTRNFYFGCEADDRMNALAFDTRLNAFGAELKAIFSSDIGHWDVPDIAEVLEEAWELVDHGLLTTDNFRDFTFGHTAELYTAANADFFEGTVVAEAVRARTRP